MYRVSLHIFPLVQIVLFVTSLYFMTIQPVLAAFLLIVCALFLNFSLHITVHHFVHFPFKNKALNILFGLIYTALIGFPFNFYRFQHFNHHRFNNKIGDMTSTWKTNGDQIVPKGFFQYAFLWMFHFNIKKSFSEGLKNGDLNKNQLNRMRLEFVFLLLFYGLLIWINPIYALMYGILFYLGWSFIAITNYGQHLPINYGEAKAYTFNNKLYNFLFFNNGLHYEHHDQPQLDYFQLKSAAKHSIQLPHLLAALKLKNELKKK